MKQDSFVYDLDLARACPSDLPLSRLEIETAGNGDKLVTQRLLTPQQILDESTNLSPVACDPSDAYVPPTSYVDNFTEMEAIRSQIDSLDVSSVNTSNDSVTIQNNGND